MAPLDNASPSGPLQDPFLARYSERQLAVANTWATHFSSLGQLEPSSSVTTCAAPLRPGAGASPSLQTTVCVTPSCVQGHYSRCSTVN